MRAVDQVFRPSDDEDHEQREEPNSVSKLSKGDAAFAEIKRCLGWDYAVKSKTLLVAPHREERVRSSIAAVIDQRRVGRSTWESLVGQLRSLVPGIPGSEGQFSLLQASLADGCQKAVTHLFGFGGRLVEICTIFWREVFGAPK